MQYFYCEENADAVGDMTKGVYESVDIEMLADVAEKRAALLNMAVTSKWLSGLALAILWKNMNSLDPVVNVINAMPAPEEGPMVTWIDAGGECGYWVRIPITSTLY